MSRISHKEPIAWVGLWPRALSACPDKKLESGEHWQMEEFDFLKIGLEVQLFHLHAQSSRRYTGELPWKSKEGTFRPVQDQSIEFKHEKTRVRKE